MEKSTLKKEELDELNKIRENTKKSLKTVKTKENKKETKEYTKKIVKKKKGIFGSIKSYFKGVKKEIGRIRWTGGKELIKYSVASILFIVFLGVYFYVIDLAIALLRSLV